MAEPNLNVEFSAVTDEKGKFRRLAKLLGLADADHARGKCEHLWLACTRRGETDLPQWLVEEVLGERGPAALVDAELARWTSGRGDSKTRRMRISGARKHCTWLASKTEQSSKGGKARASQASRVGGKFVQNPTSPNQPSDSDPISDPIPEDQNLSLAHAIPPSTEPTPLPSTTPAQSFAERDLAKLRERGALAEATWLRLSAMREKHATKLRLAGSLPFPLIHPGNHPRGFRELLERIREEGDNAHTACDHVLAVLDKQAADTRSIEWLAEKAFLAGPWEKARNTVLKQRKPAAAAPPTTPIVPVASPDERSSWLAEDAAKIAPQLLADGKESA